MILRYLLYLRGLTRLRFGFCPYCNSSPPDQDCPVCFGDLDYWRGNAKFTDEKKHQWRARWRQVFEVLK